MKAKSKSEIIRDVFGKEDYDTMLKCNTFDIQAIESCMEKWGEQKERLLIRKIEDALKDLRGTVSEFIRFALKRVKSQS